MRRATSHTCVLQALASAMLVAVVFGTAPDASVAQPAAALDWERRTAQAARVRAEQRARMEQSRGHAQMPDTMYASTPDPSPPPHPFPLDVSLKSGPERSDAPVRARSAGRVGHRIALFPSASHWAREGGYQGFARVINRSDAAGAVRIEAFDDAGMGHGAVSLSIGAGETVHFNSEDLEEGNAKKGLSQGTGAGEGDWRLELSSALDVEVLSYIRTKDGFLTAMHDVVPSSETGHRVAIFNPGSNPNQVSRLRVVNPGAKAARVSIEGLDDDGESSAGAVVVTVPAGASRTVSAKELEDGGQRLTGAFGRGKGKWQLTVTSGQAIEAMSLLSSPTGHLTNLSTVPGSGGGHGVALFPSAARWAQQGYQGFARVINRSDRAGVVRIEAVDDAGMAHGAVSLRIGAGETVHFNSGDLEEGNANKGLAEGTGSGTGDWRLEFTSGLDLEVLAYIRTEDGFLTAMHDVAPEGGGAHEVLVFNPGSNANQVSRLRVVNPGGANARVRIEGVDDAGASPGDAVEFTLPGGRARTLSAQELESGQGRGLSGGLGTGKGKWRLAVTANRPIEVMSLLSSPTGHLTNLSTVPAPGETAAGVFAERISGPVVQGKCILCHVDGGVAGATRLLFVGASSANHEARNLKVFEDFIAKVEDAEVEDGATYILNKIQGVAHGGGVQVANGTPEFADMQRFLGLLGEGVESAPLTPQTLFDTVTLASPRKTLRRAALIFAGRIPTDAEYAAAERGADALRAAIRGLMTGPEFHEFLIRASNDRLLTERDFRIIDSDYGGYLDFVNETYRRKKSAYDGDNARKRQDFWDWHDTVQYGFRRAPLALIAHVVENDLPYTDILTADYIMANPWAAKAYGAPTHHFDDPDDIHEFKPSSIESYYRQDEGYEHEYDRVIGAEHILDPGTLITEYPHAGILNTTSFLFRYPTTATNRNRARSRWTYYHFLGLDIEKSASRTTDPVALADTNNPTLLNPACTVCHVIVDPVAGAYQNYADRGHYKYSWGGVDSLDNLYKNASEPPLSIEAESWDDRQTLSWTVPLAAGAQTLRVLYSNHFYNESTDFGGSIYLDRLRVTDPRGGVVLNLEFEDVTPPVPPGGHCGNKNYNPATDREDHLLLWGGNLECALYLEVEVPSSGRYKVEVVAWSIGQYEQYEDDGYAKLSIAVNPYQSGDTWYRDMRSPSFNGKLAPNSDNSVQWLAKQIVADKRFAEATVKFWWPAIMGSEIADPPEDEGDADFEGLLLAANAEGAEVIRLANGFRRGFRGRAAHNLKDLLVEVVLSKWFRADTVEDADPIRNVALRDAGARRLLTPEELDRKTAAITGYKWGRVPRINRGAHRGPLSRLTNEYRLVYGGIDSDGVTERARDVTPVMAGVAKRHAARMSCQPVMRDFFLVPEAERRLFAGIDRFVTPGLEFGDSFEIEAGSRDEKETISVNGALRAGTKTVRLAFTNDYWGGDDNNDRNVHLDRLVVRNSAGRIVASRELEELPSGDCRHPNGDNFALWCNATVVVPIEISTAGRYSVEVVVWADQAGDELARLKVVVEDANGSGAGADAIRSKLVELYDKLLGVQVTPHSTDVESAYRLFVNAMERRRAGQRGQFEFWHCANGLDVSYFDGILDDAVVVYEEESGHRWYGFDWDRVNVFMRGVDWSDPYRTAQAWVVVLAYLMMDYRYLYL